MRRSDVDHVHVYVVAVGEDVVEVVFLRRLVIIEEQMADLEPEHVGIGHLGGVGDVLVIVDSVTLFSILRFEGVIPVGDGEGEDRLLIKVGEGIPLAILDQIADDGVAIKRIDAEDMDSFVVFVIADVLFLGPGGMGLMATMPSSSN